MLNVLPACQERDKRRVVYAKRDFPEGCGPLARPVDGKPKTYAFRAAEPGTLDLVVPVLDEDSCDHVEFSKEEKPLKPEDLALRGSLDSLRERLAGSSKDLHRMERVEETLVHENKVAVENLVPGIKLECKKLSQECLEMPNSPYFSEGQDPAGGVAYKLYGPPRRRRVSATRDFPPGCGRNAVNKEVPSSSNDTKVHAKACIEEPKAAIEGTALCVDNKQATLYMSERGDPKQWKELGVKEVDGDLKAESVFVSNFSWTNSERTEGKVLAGEISRNIGEGVKGIGQDVSAWNNLEGNIIGGRIEKTVVSRGATGVKLQCINLEPVYTKVQTREAQEGMLAQLDKKSKPISEAVEKNALNAAGESVNANLRKTIKSRKRELFEVLEQEGTVSNFPSPREESMSPASGASRPIVLALMAARK